MNKILVISLLVVFTFGASEAEGQVVNKFIKKRKETAEKTAIKRTGKEADKAVTKEVNKALDKLFGKEEESAQTTSDLTSTPEMEDPATESTPDETSSSHSSKSSGSMIGRNRLMSAMGITSGNAKVKPKYDYDAYIEMTLQEYNDDEAESEPVIYKTYASSKSLDYAMVFNEENQDDLSVIIFDTENNLMLTLTDSDGEKTGFAVSFTPEQSEAITEEIEEEEELADPYSSYKTGNTKKILGYKCEEYVIEDDNEITIMWITDELNKEMRKSYMQNSNFSSLFVHSGDANGVTMEYIVEDKNDKDKTIMTVTDIDMNKNNSISTQGYEILNMGGSRGRVRLYMDLNDFLSNSAILLKKEEIAAILGPDKEVYKRLIDLSFSRDMPVCWRAAWVVDYLAEIHPWMAEEYIERAWKEIGKKHPDGVTRSTLRMLSRYDIPEEYQGVATDQCLDWLVTESVPVAIKAYSMEMLLKIARIYPELGNEFITVLEDQAPYNSAGFKARAKHIIKEMNKL